MAGSETDNRPRLSPEQITVNRYIAEAKQQVPAFIESHVGLLRRFGLNHGGGDEEALLEFLEGCVTEHLLFIRFCSSRRSSAAVARLAFETQAGVNEDLFSDRSKIIGVTLKRLLRISG